MLKSISKRARGVVGNALVWSTAWIGIGLSFLSALYLTSDVPRFLTGRLVLYFVTTWGFTGFLTGGAFSVFLSVAYRDRNLSDIKVGPFAFAGAVIAGVFAPGVNAIAPFAANFPSALHPFVVGSLWAPILGGVTAGVTMMLAHHASRQLARTADESIESGSINNLARVGTWTLRLPSRRRV